LLVFIGSVVALFDMSWLAVAVGAFCLCKSAMLCGLGAGKMEDITIPF
jgi:putative Ca2+/H+ antiporter (TMEM165/GDT1 family)